MTDRYDTSGNTEAQFEPGSDQTVLVNKLGITDSVEMVDVELYNFGYTILNFNFGDTILNLGNPEL